MHTTIYEWQQKLSTKQISAVELAQLYLNKIQSSKLNAFIDVNINATLEQAKQADELLANNPNIYTSKPLLGIPIAHKDVFVTKIWYSTAGSKMLDNYQSPFDASVVESLYEAGMVCIGKTNMDEFAMGSSNENSYYGAVSNPWHADYVAGGSSGGSAAAVASGLTPAATGSDTGGSVRQPASFCGISGIKPTYGSISRYGMIAYASSLDQAGIMAHTAQDCALLLQIMVKKDSNDSTNILHPRADFVSNLENNWQNTTNNHQPLTGLRIGIPQQFIGDIDIHVQHAIEQNIKQLQSLGAKCIDIDLPLTKMSIPAYYVIAAAEASSNLSRFDGVRYGYRAENYTDLADMYKKTRTQGFGEEVKKRIMVGSYVLAQGYYEAYYLQAQKIRRLIAEDFINAFKQCDVIIGPVSPTPSWVKGQYNQDPAQMYLADIFTLGASLAGLPCMSLPCGFSEIKHNNEQIKLPIGLQLIAPHFHESEILQIANIYQKSTDWHTKHPVI